MLDALLSLSPPPPPPPTHTLDTVPTATTLWDAFILTFFLGRNFLLAHTEQTTSGTKEPWKPIQKFLRSTRLQ